MKASHPRKNCAKAFTLVELLVILAVLGLLSCLVLPALARAKPKSVTAQCLNNKRQLQVACALYASDFADYMVPNAAAGSANGWVTQTENWFSAIGNTNLSVYLTPVFAPYLNNNIGAYRCPGDTIPSANGIRLRSISMNGQVGSVSSVPNYNPGYKLYVKVTDTQIPSSIWIFCDESMYSLNDGYLQSDLNSPDYPDCPAAYHDRGNCFTFVDGHSEFHQWGGAQLLGVPYQPEVFNGGQRVSTILTDPDYVWVKAHTAEHQ